MALVAVDPRLVADSIEQFGRRYLSVGRGIYQVEFAVVDGRDSLVVLADAASPWVDELPDSFGALDLPVRVLPGRPGRTSAQR